MKSFLNDAEACYKKAGFAPASHTKVMEKAEDIWKKKEKDSDKIFHQYKEHGTEGTPYHHLALFIYQMAIAAI